MKSEDRGPVWNSTLTRKRTAGDRIDGVIERLDKQLTLAIVSLSSGQRVVFSRQMRAEYEPTLGDRLEAYAYPRQCKQWGKYYMVTRDWKIHRGEKYIAESYVVEKPLEFSHGGELRRAISARMKTLGEKTLVKT